MNILSFSIRNVKRNWHRTLITTVAMGFAGFIMILYAALIEGLVQVSERNAVVMNVGDIQIHAPNYRDDPDLYKRIHNPDALIARLRDAGFFAAQRLYGFGLAAAGSASAGVQLRGIHLKNEKTVTLTHRHVMAGSWLDSHDAHGVVIGRKLARTLGIKPGDEVIFVGQAADGSMANDLYTVRGILKSITEEVDRAGLFMIDRAFRELMVIPAGSHEIAIMRPDRATDLNATTDTVAGIAPGLDVKNWRQLQPIVARLIDVMDRNTIIMVVIAYVAVAMVVLNAMLMSVFERIHEFGVMKAIGVTPRQLVLLVYAETMVQVLLSSLIAVGLGLPVSHYFEKHGIDLSDVMSSTTFGGVAIDPVWYAYLTPWSVILPVVALVIIAAIAVLYPAIKAAVIQPVKAIYYR